MPSWTIGIQLILRIHREIPGLILFSLGFFCFRLSAEDKMTIREKSITKILLFQVKDWDSYQILMRSLL
ncbi:MAG: hypothetical protein DSY80_01750 [Desulfocapsa sp.]|nr:MAG: hypothetical protein DSY80_01750 [Desulfocapsa sp.]